MKILDLTKDITTKEARRYLFSDTVIAQADDRKSTGNRGLTKGKAWMIFVKSMGNIDDAIVNKVIVRNMIREFGSYYE